MADTTIRPTYLAPCYVQVDQGTYDGYRDTIQRMGGVERIDRPLPTALTDGLRFVSGSTGATPEAGDEIGVGVTERLDIFTAQGRYFVLYES